MVERKDRNCEYDDWRTPPEVVTRAHLLGYKLGRDGIEVDPATGADNPTKAERPITPEEDGLKTSWTLNGNPQSYVFLNPPYGGLLEPFLLKLTAEVREGRIILALLSCSRWEQCYWQSLVFNPALTCLCFPRGRLQFVPPPWSPILEEVRTGKRKGLPQGNTHPSLIAGYNVPPGLFHEVFASLGLCLSVSSRTYHTHPPKRDERWMATHQELLTYIVRKKT